MTIMAMGLAILRCGGYGSSMQANRGTAIVIINAQSGRFLARSASQCHSMEATAIKLFG
jgi:hypothetical protein